MSPEDAVRLRAFLVKENIRFSTPAASPVGRRAVQDFNQERVLDRLLVYERRIEHSLYRTMAELRKERLLRQAEGGLPRSTGILPVSSMGTGSQTRDDAFGGPVPPMTVQDTHGQACPELVEGDGRDIHGQGARAAHGRDAHATEPEGGTLNEGGDKSCETNPICAGSSLGSPDEVCETKRAPSKAGAIQQV